MSYEASVRMAEKVAQATPPTSIHLSSRSSSAQGFTLIELMVVIAIIAGSVVLVLPRLGNRNNLVKATLRELTTLSRQLHTHAKLQGTTYRLVLDMKEGPDTKPHRYWVEVSNKKVLVKTGKTAEEAQREAAQRDKDAKDPDGFERDTKILKEVKDLPADLIFESVELKTADAPITSGKAYIHYLPQGLAEDAAIHIKTSDQKHWTISIHPLTGKASLLSQKMDLREIHEQ